MVGQYNFYNIQSGPFSDGPIAVTANVTDKAGNAAIETEASARLDT